MGVVDKDLAREGAPLAALLRLLYGFNLKPHIAGSADKIKDITLTIRLELELLLTLTPHNPGLVI